MALQKSPRAVNCPLGMTRAFQDSQGPFQPRILRIRRSGLLPGITLLEVMVAVALIGVLAAVAVPNFFDQIREQRIRAESRKVRGVLVNARNVARLRNQVVQVTVATDTITYSALAAPSGGYGLDEDGIGTPTLGASVFSKTEKFKGDSGDSSLIKLDNFVSASSSSTTLFFNQSGGTTLADVATLQIRNVETNDPILKVQIFPAIGSVKELIP